MTFKRVLYLFMSLTILCVGVVAACMPHSQQAIASERPTWADAFISDYELRHGGVDSDTETMLLHGANASCGDLVAKSNLSQVWKLNVDRGMSSDQSGTVIMLAIKYYCPEFDYLYTAPFIPKGQ